MSCHSYQDYLCTFSIFFEISLIHLYVFTQLRYRSQKFYGICRVWFGSNNDESELILSAKYKNLFLTFLGYM
jgi:hypothetical protein